MTPAAPPVTLANCADEPIHIPGAVQTHGALFAFDPAGLLCAWSGNVPAEFGLVPEAGLAIGDLPFEREVIAFLERAARGALAGDAAPQLLETVVRGREYDLVAHGHEGRLIAEFERRPVAASDIARFSLAAHRGIESLRRARTLEALLETAVLHVREVTGFDRVMAYRFRHDGSGDVVAEAVRGDWAPFLGMRYPASDIPAQARRLYTINTLRLIADVDSKPVPLFARDGEAPLDLSHAVLRSVSPIHIEYLQNMGVGASMSVSIVVGGELWGLLACHHGGPRQVPYALRMACDVFAQILAAGVQGLEARAVATATEDAANVRAALIESMVAEDDMLAALHAHAEGLRESLGADALILCQGGKLLTHGDVDRECAQAIVATLPADREDLVERNSLTDWPEDARDVPAGWIGLLALPFDPPGAGWVVALRREQVQTVRWGGKPEKSTRVGPMGHRLTPRGSFEEWREVVRGTAEPWDDTRHQIARRLVAEMYRACNRRHAELERMRTQLLAVLGHDLRDPLQTITLAARVLEMGADAGPVGKRIQASSNRMQRLIGHVLDLSRLQGGLGLGVHRADVDVALLVRALVEEWRISYPGNPLELVAPSELIAAVDPDRFTQVVSNLVSNARHHGEPNQPIVVSVEGDDARLRFSVRNVGAPIADDLVPDLFKPFKRRREAEATNRSGMGLGLYIANEIVGAHGGTLAYAYEAPAVVFTVETPRRG
jgi:chemotaxis family two-component system sensor kinase Cph1